MAGTRGSDDTRRTKKGNGAKDRARNVYVFTEGEVTEVTFIDFLTRADTTAHRSDPRQRVEVDIVNRKDKGGEKRKPDYLVHAAVEKLRDAERDAKQSGIKKNWWNWPQVWCLFDCDQHNHIPEMFALANRTGVKIAYSHPCFELWRLLHYQNYTSTFGGVCDDAADRLKRRQDFRESYGAAARRLSDEQAKIVMPKQVARRYATARQHARKLNEQHTHHDPTRWDPYTDVWEFVESGLLIADY